MLRPGNLIASINPLDQLEEEHISFALNWIQHSPQIFRVKKPDIPDLDLVSYFVLFDKEEIKILLSENLNYAIQEFNQIGWFKTGEIPFAKSDPHMARFIDKLNKFMTLNSYEASANQYAENTASLHLYKEARQFVEMLPKAGYPPRYWMWSGKRCKDF